MKKTFLILIAVLLASAVQAQLPFTYEIKEHGGLYYAYFYKDDRISDKDLIIQYRMVFPTNRSSQSRMATILSLGSQDRSQGVNEWFEIQITSYDVRDGGASSGSSSSSSSSSGSSSESSSSSSLGPSVNAADVVWAETNVGADHPEDYGNVYTFRQAQRACPKGWRTPTPNELKSLLASQREWTRVNGVEGYRVNTGSQELFFPAIRGGNGAVSGLYWSDTPFRDEYAWDLGISDKYGSSVSFGAMQTNTQAVRCVRK